MIIYDLPPPILSAIPRPHLLQLQAATVRQETCTHTQMPDTVTCVHTCTARKQTNTRIWFSPGKSNISHAQFAIMSKWEPTKLHPVSEKQRHHPFFAALKKMWCYTSPVPRFAISGTWLTSLCGICLPLSMHHVFHCAKLPAAGPNKSWENPESSR